MQNTVKKRINSNLFIYDIVHSYFSVSFFLTLFCSIYFILLHKDRGYYVCLVLAFFPIAYILSKIIHEVGHVIIGICVGLILYDLSLPFFRIKKENTKWIIRRNDDCRFYCHMNCEDEISTKASVGYLLGGIVFNFIILLLCILFFLKMSVIGEIFLIANFFCNLETALRNGIPFGLKRLNDGMTIRQLISDKNQVKLFNIQLKVTYYLEQAGVLKEIKCFDISNLTEKENDLTYYVHTMNYYINLAKYRIEEAQKEMEIMFDNIGCYSLDIQNSILVEYVYINCLAQKNIDNSSDTIFSRKNIQRNYDYYCALYYYLKRINKKEDADLLKSSLNIFYNSNEKNEFMRIKNSILNERIPEIKN